MSSRPLYKPIDRSSNSIRLLRLLKGAKHYEDDPIRCELFEVPLPDDDFDEAYYDALSYTWGDASQTGTIILDGRPTTVTANLREALRYLRETDEDRILWVDAVCINQGDSSERTHQVGKMGDIFKKAKEVIIWLGTATKEIELLLDAVKVLDKKMLRIPKPPVNDPNYLEAWLNAARKILAEMGLENIELREMRTSGLRDMLSRAWWSRIWVIQEAANAPRARIQCSWHSVSTRTFALMPQLMGIAPGPREQVLLEVLPGPLRKHSWWHKNRSLETLLNKFQYSESTEECDQIYALLGMSSEAAVPGCPLQPDYSLHMAGVVKNVVSFLAFGELIDLKACPLPPWNLAELRSFMSTLKPSMLAWAITENKPALIRKLILGKPPHVDINDRLPTDVPIALPPQMRFLLPPPIHLAISFEEHSASLVKLLMECEDLDVNVPGFEPLDFTATVAEIDIDISRVVNKYTPLSHAVSKGRMDLIRLLLGHPKIKPGQKDPEGFSPIARALEHNQIEIAEALMTPDTGILKNEGWRLLHWGIEKNNVNIVRRLLSYPDVDVNRVEGFFTPLTLAANLGHNLIILELSSRKDLNIEAVDSVGYYPLERAVQGRRPSTMILLMKQFGATPQQFRDDWLLHRAIEHDWPEVVETLISQGLGPDGTRRPKTDFIWTSPLALAIKYRRSGIVRRLLEAGVDPAPSLPLGKDSMAVESWCPMVSAIQSGSPKMLDTLINTGRGAHTTAWNTPNESPLLYAIRERHVTMVELLLERGADVEARTARRKLSSFWLAVEYNAPQIMRLLADAGADFKISAESHPNIYQGKWGLKFTPWFGEFLRDKGLSDEDVWEFGEEEEVLYNDEPLKDWEWESARRESTSNWM
ncbi:heterokaryon incompatibility protein-domain-containing protein [Plectosphaerella plurivora]|uniref:Heterokaryon incompatibility protein-domain-containing protein n=1 Tax=Plectosphaerella plurivora TaxID=936078 RepID=A0A9P8VBY7_9PEZI|nr:heterokaryon incompatibility protein-domain-containing protein [Plectosphaerella plurivora]